MYSNGKYFWISCLIAAMVAGMPLWASGRGDNTGVLRAVVKVYGNEPHTYAGLEAGGKHYAIWPPSMERQLRALQGRTLDFTVRFVPRDKNHFVYGSIFLKDGTITPIAWKEAGTRQ
jgi:hypothetical protein